MKEQTLGQGIGILLVSGSPLSASHWRELPHVACWVFLGCLLATVQSDGTEQVPLEQTFRDPGDSLCTS